MEKAKKDVGQKFRRIKHNLVNSSKKDDDDDLRIVNALEHRNAKMIAVLSTYKKNVANTIKTGLREENVDKRRVQAFHRVVCVLMKKLHFFPGNKVKKLDEFVLCADLRDGAQELESIHATCLHKVMNKISQTVQYILDEKVKHDMMIEKRVLDDLSHYQEMDKNLAKSREKLTNAFTDMDIARRAFDKADKSDNSAQLQDNVDAAHQRLENQKDNTITDIYTMVAREQEISKVFASLLEEQLEYHRFAMRQIEMTLPEIRRDIDNARPRPMFGVDLTEHLRHSQTRIAVVLEKCCCLLRATGFTEKGLFRVSGNNTKIRRMKSAFDAGQIESDERAYHLDPHSVCSVLKCYLRELPDPLLTHRLHNDWLNAARCDGEDRLRAIEQCIGQLPAAHRDNLTYLVHFLVELLQYQEVTAMNAGNLAIVFGPNLLGGDIEGNNAVGTRIVETLLRNATRLFGCPMNGDVTFSSPPPSEMTSSTRSLNVDTSNSNFQRRDTATAASPAIWSASPRTRPKEKAPPPPTATRQSEQLIDFSDDWTPNQTTEATRQYATNRPEISGGGSLRDDFSDRGGSALEHYGLRRTPSLDSDDSFNEYHDDSLTRSNTERKPPTRPPPTYRTSWDSSQGPRPTSYTMAVGYEPSPQPRSRPTQAMVIENPMARQRIQRPTILPDNEPTIGVSDDTNRTVVSVEAPPIQRPKPPLPVKPKPDDKESTKL